MLEEHISPNHTRVNLNIDVDRLGKEYLDFKYHLGFKTDNPANVDFNAICINRIPGDPRSISGGNVRGLYWTMPDTTNVEEQRLPFVVICRRSLQYNTITLSYRAYSFSNETTSYLFKLA
jgi:hypothetical protein